MTGAIVLPSPARQIAWLNFQQQNNVWIITKGAFRKWGNRIVFPNIYTFSSFTNEKLANFLVSKKIEVIL